MGSRTSLVGLALLYAGCAGTLRCDTQEREMRHTKIYSPAQSAVIQVTSENFDDVVLRSSRPIVVDFYADWCGHCRDMERPYREAAQAMASRMRFAKYNVESDRTIPQRYRVTGYPTFIVFDDGHEICRIDGFRHDIQRDLEACLE